MQRKTYILENIWIRYQTRGKLVNKTGTTYSLGTTGTTEWSKMNG